ncbi:PAS domain-containing sensor histidine kinase [Variovorax sp. VNK109]|uniref:PAS domain-containing sensor histidine kinase n=1 Tax=Variovorax sp. VNK109 TaxID=3400919 RepID=UPI003C099029
MPLKLARDLLQDRYTPVMKYTLLVLMVALPLMLVLSISRDNNPLQSAGVAVLSAIVYLFYWLLHTGRERWVAPMLIFTIIGYTTWDIYAYGSVRSAGVIGYVCAVVGAGIMLRRRVLAAAILLSLGLLGALTWAEIHGHMHRDDFSVTSNFWLTHVTAILGASIGVATSRLMVQKALRDQREEYLRREEAERERRRSQEQVQRVFQISPSGIMVQSVQTRLVVDINPAFERMWGYERHEYFEPRHNEKLWVYDHQRENLLERLLTEGRISNCEMTCRRKDGTIFNALISSEIGGEGADRIIVSTVTDISAEVQARERVQKSEELFSKAFNFSPLNMTITRVSDGMFLAVNGAEDTVQGYTASELVGRSSVEMGAWLSEEDRLQFVERLRREGQIMRMETRMRHRQGHVVDCRVWAVIVDIDEVPCVLSCTLSIVEEKRREAMLLDVARGVSGEVGELFFRQLAQHLGKALGADLVMVGELVSSREVASLALMSDGNITAPLRYSLDGTPCDIAIGWDDMCIYIDRVHEIFPEDVFLAQGNYRAYMGMALRDADGSPIGILNALWRSPLQASADRDALMRIFASRANAELLRLRREREILRLNETLELRVAARTAELQATNAELESFAYSVSHDLQTPLRGIDGFTALLGDQLTGTLSDEQKRMFGRVRINVSRMGELIADLLGLAKVSKREMNKQKVDLSALAGSVLESACQPLKSRQITWRVEPGLHCDCDKSLAQIALENLIGNAVKYTGTRESALIEIGRVAGSAGQGPLVVFIRDNGVGFDMTYADKLFKPFNRLHHEHEFAGSGVGLATVHRILERHGGGICANATPDAGATFHFSFDTVPAPLAGTQAPRSETV